MVEVTKSKEVAMGTQLPENDQARMLGAAGLIGATRSANAPPADAPDETYASDLEKAKAALSRLLQRSDQSKKKEAVATHEIVARLIDAHPNRHKKQIFKDVSNGLSSQRAATIKRTYLSVECLKHLDRMRVIEKGNTSWSVIAEVTLKGLDDDVTKQRLDMIAEHDIANPATPFTVARVRAMPAASPQPALRKSAWRRKGFDWAFGDSPTPGGLPRDAIATVLDRWLAGNRRFVAAGCGACDGIEAAALLDPTVDARAIDVLIDDAAKATHADRAVALDVTCPDWQAAVPESWRADLVLLALPGFSVAATEGQRVLGTAGVQETYIAAWRGALKGVKSILASNGVVAVATRPNVDPPAAGVPLDLEFAVLSALHAEGLAGAFLGRVVIRPRSASQGSSSVQHLSVYRSK